MSDIAVILLTAPPDATEPPGAMVKIDGRESVLRAMELFANREGIVQTMLVIPKAEAEQIKQKLGSHLMFMGIKLVQGGATWFDQLADAQKALSPDARHVFVHDAARPAVAYTEIDALLNELGKQPALALATRLRGTILSAKSVPGPGQPLDTKVARLLTPQLFTREGLEAAVAAKKLPDPLPLIEGSPLNARCGSSEPSFVKAMIGLLPKPKVKAPSSPFEEAQW